MKFNLLCSGRGVMEFITKYFDEDIVPERGITIADPERQYKNTVLVFIHGGGWSGGNRENYIHHLQYFSRKGFLCASLGYRLAPGASLKEQMEDVSLGYDRLCSYAKENKYEVKNIIVMGSSAGAHLAALLSLSDPIFFNPEIQLKNPWKRPRACIFVNGPATLEKWAPMDPDIKRSIEKFLRAPYDGPEAEIFSLASPINHVGNDSPDFLFMLSGQEKYFPHTFTYEMSDKLKALNKYAEVVMFEEACHGFFYFLNEDVQKRALKLMESFLERYEEKKL